MAIVPQIATVVANTEVQPFFAPSDIAQAVEGAQPSTHVTLNPGVYPSVSVDVPQDVFVTALPGADLSDVTLTGATGNVSDLSVIGGVNPDRVQTLTSPGGSIALSAPSGDVDIDIAAEGVTTAKIAEQAVTLPKIDVAGSPQVDQVVSYDGTGLRWGTASELDLGLQSDAPVSGDGSSAAPFTLDTVSTASIVLSLDVNALAASVADAGVTTSKISPGAVTADRMSSGTGDDGQFLRYTQSTGLSWDTLTADAVEPGVFEGVYSLDGELQVRHSGAVVGAIDGTGDGFEVSGANGASITFVDDGASSVVRIDLPNNSIDVVVTFPDTNQFNSATVVNGYDGRPFVGINSAGGIVLPMLQDQVADDNAPGNVRPPEGYMALYAQEGGGGNSQRGLISKISPDGAEDAF